MSDKPFFDTTILIYAATSGDPRCEIAEALLASGGCISVQVMNEFTAVARRKLKMSWEEISETLAIIRTLCDPVAPITIDTHTAALAIAEDTGYQIYDALILASAAESGCSILYSEDMQDGRKLGSLDIRNPFARPSA